MALINVTDGALSWRSKRTLPSVRSPSLSRCCRESGVSFLRRFLEQLKFDMVTLRYVDSVNYQGNAFEFLANKLKLTIDIYDKLFDGTGVNNSPSNMGLLVSYNCTQPSGIIDLRVRRGERAGAAALVWETQVNSHGTDVPKTKEGIMEWVDQAHTLTDDWFFKLIAGDLLEEFE